MLVRACAGLRHAEGVARLRQTGSRASGIVMQWTLPPPAAKRSSSGSKTSIPSARSAALISGAVARRDDTVAAERQQIARHRHHFAIGRVDHADSARFQPVGEIVAQDLDAGHRKLRRSHTEENVEVKEMFGEGMELRLPALVREPAGELGCPFPRCADFPTSRQEAVQAG